MTNQTDWKKEFEETFVSKHSYIDTIPAHHWEEIKEEVFAFIQFELDRARKEERERLRKARFVKNWREGQTWFNFLEWLVQEKGMNNNQIERCADPFFIEDDEMDGLWEEYLSKLTKEEK